NVLAPGAKEVARGIELLHPAVVAVRRIDTVRAVDSERARTTRFAPRAAWTAGLARVTVRRHADLEAGPGVAGPGARDVLAPGAEEIARGVVLVDPVVVRIGDVDVVRGVARGAEREVELPSQPATD